MATDPTFFTTPTFASTSIGTAAYGGSLTAPTGTTTILTASTTLATMVRRIEYKALGNTISGLLNLWAYDGTTYFLLPYTATITAITSSSSVDSWQSTVTFESSKPFILPPAATAWKLNACPSTGAQGAAIMATVYGATS